MKNESKILIIILLANIIMLIGCNQKDNIKDDSTQILNPIQSNIIQEEYFQVQAVNHIQTSASGEGIIFPQQGHTGFVNSVAFSPDGSKIFSSSLNDRTIRIWDVATGRLIRNIPRLVFKALTHDGSQIIAGIMVNNQNITDSTIKILDSVTGEEIKTIPGNLTHCRVDIVLSPDGRQLITIYHNINPHHRSAPIIKIWNTATWEQVNNFLYELDGFFPMAFSPDGKLLIAGSRDNGGFKILDAVTGHEIRTIPENAGRFVSFNYDGSQFISRANNELKIWDTNTGSEIISIHGNYNSIAFNPDGSHIAVTSGRFGRELIRLIDLTTGREIRTASNFLGHTSEIDCIAFSPDGRYIVSGSKDLSVRIWDASTGEEIRNFPGNNADVNSLAISPDGRSIITGSHFNRNAIIWNIATGNKIQNLEHAAGVNYVSFSPDGKHILTGTGAAHNHNRIIKLWDIISGQEFRTLSEHGASIFSIQFCPDGRYLVSGLSNGLIKHSDVISGQDIREFPGHNGNSFVIFNSDGKQILSSSSIDSSIKLWDVATDQKIKIFTVPERERIHAVSFTSCDRRFLTSSSTNHETFIRLWEISTGNIIRTVTFSPWGNVFITFNNDASQFVTSSPDGTFRILDAVTGLRIKTFSGHTGRITSVVFSSDGRQIISSSDDRSIRVWDILSGREIAQFMSFNDGEWAVFTPDGFYNASLNGHSHLDVLVDGNLRDMEEYRSVFFRPDIVEARLQYVNRRNNQ